MYNYENINLVADDDRAVDGGADEGLHEDVKVGLGRGGRVADWDPHVVKTRKVLLRRGGDGDVIVVVWYCVNVVLW